jgi:hypothetical protein
MLPDPSINPILTRARVAVVSVGPKNVILFLQRVKYPMALAVLEYARSISETG